MNQDNFSVLAFYPTTRGYAFILFERPSTPVDWGVKDIRGHSRDKNTETLADLETILERYHPDAMVIEDWSEPGSRRSARIRRLYRTLVHIAASRVIDIYRFTKRDVQKCFESVGASSKYEIAQAVARQITEIAHRLPKKRKIWESERSDMGLFAATALGITCYSKSHQDGKQAH